MNFPGCPKSHLPVAELNDVELVNERTQLKISIECGPGPTGLERINARLRDVYAELQRRANLIDAASWRIRTLSKEELRALVQWIDLPSGDGIRQNGRVFATQADYDAFVGISKEIRAAFTKLQEAARR